MKWDGNYFTTYGLPDGQIIRRKASTPEPKKACILGMDNGMLTDRQLQVMLADCRKEHQSKYPKDK